MKKIRILIVDDEPLAREGIALLLKGDEEIEVAGTCADGRAAADEIRAKHPDLVFLDIQMPRLGGLETLKSLPRKDWPVIIFVTAYERYAVRAFELGAVDYLLKPFRDARFQAALTRAKEQVRRADLGEMERRAGALLGHLRRMEADDRPEHSADDPSRAARVWFRVGHDHILVDAADIVWIEAQGNSTRLSAGGQIHLVRETLHHVERRLDVRRFSRIHRSFLINVDRVKRVTSALYGDYLMLMSDGVKVPMSRNYREKLKMLLSPPEGSQREPGHPGI